MLEFFFRRSLQCSWIKQISVHVASVKVATQATKAVLGCTTTTFLGKQRRCKPKPGAGGTPRMETLVVECGSFPSWRPTRVLSFDGLGVVFHFSKADLGRLRSFVKLLFVNNSEHRFVGRKAATGHQLKGLQFHLSANATTRKADIKVYCWRSAKCNLPTYIFFWCHTNFHSLGLLKHSSWILQDHQGHRVLSFLWLLALCLACSLLHKSCNLCYWHLILWFVNWRAVT